MAEPTSALTYEDLIIFVAEQLGVAYYGADGTEVAQVPVDAYTLDRCKRFVLDGLRMLTADAPPQGWRWQKPIAEIDLWPSVAVDATVTVVGVYDAVSTTTLTASEATFYASMVGKTITITGVGDFTIASYTSSTVVTVTGDATTAGATFSIAADGNYAMPATFGGEYLGDISFAPGTYLGIHIQWTGEHVIREYREDDNDTTNTPLFAAIRRNQTNSRRWDLLVWPTPSEYVQVQFPYFVYFDNMVELTDLHPAGFAFDEIVKAAALAQAEFQGEDMLAGKMEYYRTIMLPNAFKINDRAAPRHLGYCGNTPTRVRPFRAIARREQVTFG